MKAVTQKGFLFWKKKEIFYFILFFAAFLSILVIFLFIHTLCLCGLLDLPCALYSDTLNKKISIKRIYLEKWEDKVKKLIVSDAVFKGDTRHEALNDAKLDLEKI